MEIIFFNSRVKKFTEEIKRTFASELNQAFVLLEEYNHSLTMPLSRPLGKGLFELRIIGVIHIRFIYTYYNNHTWMLHGFIKKTERISKQDIEYARKQQKLLLH